MSVCVQHKSRSLSSGLKQQQPFNLYPEIIWDVENTAEQSAWKNPSRNQNSFALFPERVFPPWWIYPPPPHLFPPPSHAFISHTLTALLTMWSVVNIGNITSGSHLIFQPSYVYLYLLSFTLPSFLFSSMCHE